MTKDFCCTQCQAWFKEKWHLEKHIREKHTKNLKEAEQWVNDLIKRGMIK